MTADRYTHTRRNAKQRHAALINIAVDVTLHRFCKKAAAILRCGYLGSGVHPPARNHE